MTVLAALRRHLLDLCRLDIEPCARIILDSSLRWARANRHGRFLEAGRRYIVLASAADAIYLAVRGAHILGVQLAEIDGPWTAEEWHVLMCGVEMGRLEGTGDAAKLEKAINTLMDAAQAYEAATSPTKRR
jgi:hypothetical protein